MGLIGPFIALQGPKGALAREGLTLRHAYVLAYRKDPKEGGISRILRILRQAYGHILYTLQL